MQNLPKKSEENFTAVIFNLGSEQFGIDVKGVGEILKLQRISVVPKTPSFIEGVIDLRGHIIGVVDLRKFFELETKESNEETRIMIVRIKNVLTGLIVDSVLEVVSVPYDVVERTPELISSQVKNDFIRGVAKINNKMIFILDLGSVLSENQTRHLMKVGKGNKDV